MNALTDTMQRSQYLSRWIVVAGFGLIIDASAAVGTEPVSVSGKVIYDGPQPECAVVELLEKDGKLSDCSALHEAELRTEILMVNENHEIANVFVYVRKGLPRQKHVAPDAAAVLNQQGCMFRPRVQGVMIGQELILRNSDPVLHNVRALSFRNRPFNIGQPAKSGDRSRSFRRKEKAVMIQCDLHPWMQAHLFVMDHPYFAVTDLSGRFTLSELPPGQYTLTAWHEQLGNQDLTIDLTKSALPSIEFTFQPKVQKGVRQGKLATDSPAE